MSVKRAFFGVLQKIMVFCCAMFFGFADAFSANLPSGYTELEYIESTGTQYIDTGLKGNLNTKVEIDMQIPEYTSSYVGYFMGSRTNQNENAFLIGSNDATLSQNGKYFAQFDSVTSSGTGPTFDLNRHVLSLSSSGFYVDNQLYISYSNPQSFTTQENIPLFARYSAGTLAKGAFRVFSFKMYNNSTLVRNLVPAKNSSGVVGMYDTVSGNFFTNQGTGEFTAGPVVCSNGELAQTYTTATGTVTQSGAPTPTNPITPTFYTQGDMVLRRVANWADSYDATTGKITRRIGVKVLDGTEDFTYSNPLASMFNLKDIQTLVYASDRSVYSTHFKTSVTLPTQSERNGFIERSSEGKIGIGYLLANGSVDAFKSWVAEQYAAGTPVTVYYPLATPVEEDWAPEQCTSSSPIKIATTAYNSARFNPVKTDLNNVVATIREIVTNTINQTAAIASLQADKQTRPEDACPAGKKCLLVETEENGVIVPHWFPIIETPEDN